MKHLNKRLHRELFMSVVNRVCAKNPTFLQVKVI